jgi:hypothetical protein
MPQWLKGIRKAFSISYSCTQIPKCLLSFQREVQKCLKSSNSLQELYLPKRWSNLHKEVITLTYVWMIYVNSICRGKSYYQTLSTYIVWKCKKYLRMLEFCYFFLSTAQRELARVRVNFVLSRVSRWACEKIAQTVAQHSFFVKINAYPLSWEKGSPTMWSSFEITKKLHIVNNHLLGE